MVKSRCAWESDEEGFGSGKELGRELERRALAKDFFVKSIVEAGFPPTMGRWLTCNG